MNVHRIWSEEELDQALATLHADVPPGEKALARSRDRLVTAAAKPPKRHVTRWVAAGVALAALTATVFVVSSADDPAAPPAPKVVVAAAVEALNSAADKINTSDPVVRPGQYLYVATHGWVTGSLEDVTLLEENITELWVPADRTQEWLRRTTKTGRHKYLVGTEKDLKALGIRPPKPSTSEVRGRCGDFYPDPDVEPCQTPGSWQKPDAEFLAGLPTDPQQLYERLRADIDNRPEPDLKILHYVADAGRGGLVPANVRANLYRALALVPSLKVSDQSADLNGRVGIGFGVDGTEMRSEVIIDLATGVFIGERTTQLVDADGIKAGTVLGYTSTTTGVAPGIGDKPAS